MLRVTTTALIALCLTQACATDPMSSPGSADRRLRSVWEGDVAQSDAALFASGSLSSATTVQAVEDAGSSSAQVISTTSIDAQGEFTVHIQGAHDDVMLQAHDASGAVIGAVYIGAVNASNAGRHTLELTAETTVEAMIWAQAQAAHGSERVISAVDVRARVDASVAAAIQAEDDAGAAGHAAAAASIEAFAEAAVAAQATREEALQEISAMFTWTTWLMVEARAEAAASVQTTLSLEQVIDARLDRAGVGEEDRAALAAQVELAFRAALEATADAGDTTVDEAERSSLSLQVRAEAAAAASAQSAGDSADAMGDAMADALLELYVALSATQEASADAAADFRAEAEAEVRTTLESELQAAGGLTLDLLLDVGLALGATLDAVLDLMTEASADASGELHSQLDLAAEAATDVHGHIDVDAYASAVISAWADATTEISSDLGSTAWTSAEADAMASWMLAASGGCSDVE